MHRSWCVLDYVETHIREHPFFSDLFFSDLSACKAPHGHSCEVIALSRCRNALKNSVVGFCGMSRCVLHPAKSAPSGILLFLEDFYGADGRVVDNRRELDIDFALRGGFDVPEGLDQRLGASFSENIETL
jgi:hypothetical protein